MNKRYPLPAAQARAEIEILRSRFIATAGPARSVEEARALIAAVRAEFPDASHHVPAFLVGYGDSVTAHCSDAGEPAGTAGRPVLMVLQGSGLGDVALVVTRYFGGTKLGTGGLVHAYTEAAQTVLAQLPRAQKAAAHTVMLAFPYSLLERMRQLTAAHGGQVLDEEFGGDVTLTARFLTDAFDGFQQDVRELTRGSVQAEIVETDPDTIIPLGGWG